MAIISLESGVSALKMNAPPPNLSADEHAEAWRGSAYQLTDKNTCFYCENPGHGSDQCKYFNPAVRNSDWHPDPKLWVYKEVENNGKLGKHRRGPRRSQRRGPRRSKKGKADDRAQVIKTEPFDIVGNTSQDASFPVLNSPFEVVGNSGQAASFPVSAGPFEFLANIAQAASFPVSATPFKMVGNIAQAPSYPGSATPFKVGGNSTQAASLPVSATPFGNVGNIAQAPPLAVSIRPPGIAGNYAHHESWSSQRSSGFTNAIRNFNFIPLPTDIAATWNVPRHRWAITIGSYRHIANSKDCFIDYHEYTHGEIPQQFRDIDGTVRTAVGLGRVRIDIMIGTGIHGEIILKAVYCPALPFNLMSLGMLQQESGLYYRMSTYSLHELSTDRMMAHTFEQNYMLFLRTTLD